MAGETTSTRPSRAPKTVERFVPASAPVKGKGEAAAVGKGSGDKLGDIDVISNGLKGIASDHDLLKAFHSLLYGSFGKSTTRKKDIRAFNGFPKGEPTLDTRITKLVENKKVWSNGALKDLSQLLGLEKGGDREALVKRIIHFLGSPSVDDVKGGSKKRKLAGSKGGKKKKGEKGKKGSRGPSAFILFSQEKRPEVLKKKPNLSFGEVGAELGKLWREASAAVKKKYEDLSAKKKAELKAAQDDEEEEEAEAEEEEEEEADEEGDDDAKDDGDDKDEDDKEDADEEEEEEEPKKKEEPAKKKAKK